MRLRPLSACMLLLAWSGVGMASSGTASAPGIEECDRKAREAPAERSSYDCYRAFVNETGDRDLAVEKLRALASFRPDEPWLLYTLATLSRVSAEEKADLYEQAASLLADRGDEAGASRALADKGNHFIRHQEFERAEEALDRAAALADAAEAPLALLFVRIRRAKLELQQAHFDQAWALSREVLADEHFDDLWIEHRLSAMYMLTSAAVRMGFLEQAYETADWAFDLAMDAGEAKHRADAAQTLMWTVVESLRVGVFSMEEASGMAERLLPVVDAAQDPIANFQFARHLSLLAHGAQRLESIERLERIARESGHTFMMSAALAQKAFSLSLDRPESIEEALATIREAIELRDVVRDDFLVISYHKLIAQLSMRKADRDAAIEAALLAIEAVESRRVRMTSPEASARMVATQAEIHYMLADYLLSSSTPSSGDVGLALQVLEQLRARRLIQERGDTSKWPSDLRSRSREIQQEISATQLELMLEEDPQRREELRKTLDRLESREILLLGDLDRRPRVVPHSEFVRPGDVQAALEEGAVLIYFIASEGTSGHALVIDRHRVDVLALPDSRRVNAAIGMWTGALRGNQAATERILAERIAELLAPVLDDRVLASETLIISADGPYHRLPFEALLIGEARLGDARSVSYTPSATYFVRSRAARSERAERRSLVLADPRYDGETLDASVRSAAFSASALGVLPFARAEAALVSEALGPSTDVLLGDTASESYLKSKRLAEYGLIHFAAHAVVNERVPSRSAVVLTPGDGEDGLLQERDIEGLELDGAIVVLAACQSAAGEAIRGDGVMSLATSFLRAGARTVIASRWNLGDEDSSRFFGDFYTQLARGAGAAEALRAARSASSLRGDRPSAWASVLVVGDPLASLSARASNRAMSPPLLGMLGAAALVLAVGTVLALRSRRRRASARQA